MIKIEYNLTRTDLDTASPESFVASLARSYGGGILAAAQLSEQGARNEGLAPDQRWGLFHYRSRSELEGDLTDNEFVDRYLVVWQDGAPLTAAIAEVIAPVFRAVKGETSD